MSENAYNTDEAERILLDTLGDRLAPSEKQRRAAVELLGELAALADSIGCLHSHDPNEGYVVLRFGPSEERGRSTRVFYSNGSIKLGTMLEFESNAQPLPVRYNPFTDSFQGKADDTSRVPMPGYLVPKRSALAVIIEAALRAAGESPKRPKDG
jgi:hypothetical protein